MAYKKDGSEFKYSIRGLDEVFEEKGNTCSRLSFIAFNASDTDDVPDDKIVLTIRKWRTDEKGEQMSKGFNFSTKEGPHELTNLMVREGYGNTDKILDSISKRDDFREAVGIVTGVTPKGDYSEGEASFDLRDLLNE